MMAEAAFFAVFAVVGVTDALMLFRGELAGRVDVRTLGGERIRASVVREPPSGDCMPPGIRLQFRHALAIRAYSLTPEEVLAIAEALERAAATAES